MTDYKELSPGVKDALMSRMPEASPFWSLLGMELVDVKKGWARLKLPFARKLTNAIGIVHGGAIFTPADSAVGIALIGMVDKDESISTVEMKINYLKPFGDGEIFIEGKIIHKGVNIAFGDAEIKDAQGNLIAKAFATYIISKK
jgi:acyl-CoA thioesterase